MTSLDDQTDPLALGHKLLAQGQIALAAAEWRRVAQQTPDNLSAGACLLYALSLDPDCTSAAYLREAERYGQRLTERALRSPLPPYSQWHLPYAPSQGVPLRVGLVSGNFHEHPVGYFLESVLQSADPRRIQWFGYANRDHQDDLTARLRTSFTHWETVAGLDDLTVAQKLHGHGLHVLIDLDGHTDGNRLPLFAWQAAPVQVSWLGHWGSTGLPAMDFVLADPISLGPLHTGSSFAAAHHFCETVERLPDARLCFSAPLNAPKVSPLPALRKGHVTFGSFQSAHKVHPRVWRCWAQVLHAVPGSRLRLASRHPITPELVKHLTTQMAASGLSPGRVDLAHPCERGEYLEAYAQVDLVLDTFPATGGTTTCEALWMGVPTLTLSNASMQGQPMMRHQGASLLNAAGLQDWIACDESDFVRQAVAKAADLTALAELRQHLRARVQQSPLMDAPRFAQALDAALRRMWDRKWGTIGAQ